MTDEKLIELMNNEIDGLNTPSQSERVKKQMAADPESQAQFESLRSLSHILNQVEEVEPPESLKYTIMNSIPRYKYSAPQNSSSGFEFLRSLSKSIFTPRYAFSFAAGTAAGLLFFALYSGNFGVDEIDPATVLGAIGGQNQEVAIVIADHAEFAFETISGSVTTSTSGSSIWTTISLVGKGEISVALFFRAEDLRLSEVYLVADSSLIMKSNLENILLVLSGPGEHTVSFDRLSANMSPIKVRIDSKEELFEQVMSTVPK